MSRSEARCPCRHVGDPGVCVLAPKHDMGGLRRGHELAALVSQCPQVNSIEQWLTSAEQNRRNSEVYFIDETCMQILPDRVRPTANAHVHSAGRMARPIERVMNTAGDEVER